VLEGREYYNVVEFNDLNAKDTADGWQRLLYLVMEEFGYYPSKHDEYRLVIDVEPGDD
jgi:hypothetical protein